MHSHALIDCLHTGPRSPTPGVGDARAHTPDSCERNRLRMRRADRSAAAVAWRKRVESVHRLQFNSRSTHFVREKVTFFMGWEIIDVKRKFYSLNFRFSYLKHGPPTGIIVQLLDCTSYPFP